MSWRHGLLGLLAVFATACFEAIVRTADDAGVTCSEGLTLCGDVCVELRRDLSHCGACDTPCSPGAACASGNCLPVDCPGTDCAEDQVCEQGRCLGIDCVGVGCGAGACYRGACLPEACGTLACPAGQVCDQEVCLDPRCVGVRCASGLSCVSGACVVGCVSGSTCSPAAPCRLGQTTCVDGGLGCADVGAVTPGTSCVGGVCGPTGTCGACDAGDRCTPAACFIGAVSCATGLPSCAATGQLVAGSPCGTGRVCSADGGCLSCDAGVACAPGNQCLVGVTSCGTGTLACLPSGPAASGALCGTNQVCDGDGGCVACVAGSACTPHDAPCFDGVLSCSAGVTCNRNLQRDAGSSCGTGKVCAPDAGCVDCVPGASCDAGTCLLGALACGSGTPRCTFAGYTTSGTACGSGQFCNGDGGCGACSPGGACSTGNVCEFGVITCGTGSPVCVGLGPKPPGVICRTSVDVCDAEERCAGLVCPPDLKAPEGAICGSSNATACDAQDSCNGAGACLNRVKGNGVSCRAAVGECDLAETCDGLSASCPGDAHRLAGASCVGGVCDGNLTCNACSLGAACGSNPNSCFDGIIQCGTGVAVCADNLASPRVPGAACVGGVCNGAGVCTPCVAGSACSTNPGTCFAGVIVCGSGAPVCTNNAASPRPSGTNCGSSNASACDAQDTCDGAGLCVNRVKSVGVVCRVAGASAACNPAEVCDGVSAACPLDLIAASGTSCGSSTSTGCDEQDTCDAAGSCVDRIKSAGVICLAAGADAICDPAEVCNGSTATCPPNAFAPLGTSCGSSNATDCDAQDTCSGAGACINRVKASGATCRAAVAECDLAETCNGTTTSCPPDVRKPAGTACIGGVCDGNLTCNACVAGSLCTTNPSVCFNGLVQCGTGVAVCTDNLTSPKAPGAACPGGVCNGSGACTPCVEGAVCATNPNACLNGAVACGSGAPVCNDNASSPKAPGTACGSSTSTACDAQDTCDGAGACVNRVKSAGAVCFAAGADPTCDPSEVCDGATAICPPNAFAPAGTSCGSPSTVACDAADTCNGLGACVDRVKSAGVICRPAADPICDVPESCSGSAATCPADAVALNGTVCEAETCDFTVCQANCAAEPLCNSRLCTSGACLPGVPRVLAGGCAARPCSRPPAADGFCCNAACSDTGC
ncbi:MAG: hypothetical protein Q8L48_19130 [Archangium sp.]|nr:hypothetical protein [Archangium sp.]